MNCLLLFFFARFKRACPLSSSINLLLSIPVWPLFLLSRPDSSLLPNLKNEATVQMERGPKKKRKKKQPRINSSKLYVWEKAREHRDLFFTALVQHVKRFWKKRDITMWRLTHRSPRCLLTPRGWDRKRAASPAWRPEKWQDGMRTMAFIWQGEHILFISFCRVACVH